MGDFVWLKNDKQSKDQNILYNVKHSFDVSSLVLKLTFFLNYSVDNLRSLWAP